MQGQLQKPLERQSGQDEGQNEALTSAVLAAVTDRIVDLRSFISKELAGVKSRIDQVECWAKTTSGTARQLNLIEQQINELARVQEEHRTDLSQTVIEALELEQEARGNLTGELRDLKNQVLPVLEAQRASRRLHRDDSTIGNMATLLAQLESTVSPQVHHSKAESVTSKSVDAVLSCDLGLPGVYAPLALTKVQQVSRASEVGRDLESSDTLEPRCGSSRSHPAVRSEASVVSSAPASLGNSLAAASNNTRATLPCRPPALTARGNTSAGISLKGIFGKAITDRASITEPLPRRLCMTSRSLHDHSGQRGRSCNGGGSPALPSAVKGGIPDLSKSSSLSSMPRMQSRGPTTVPMVHHLHPSRFCGADGLEVSPRARATFGGCCQGSMPVTGVAAEGDRR